MTTMLAPPTNESLIHWDRAEEQYASQKCQPMAPDVFYASPLKPKRQIVYSGPERFADLEPPRLYHERLLTLSDQDYGVVRNLQRAWEKEHDEKDFFETEEYLRFAQCSPGRPFCLKTALRVMKSFDRRFLDLNIHNMKKQLLTKTLFPIPHLLSREGHECFYMRPSRYFPNQTSTKTVIDNLCYVMGTMAKNSKRSYEDGVAFIANMNDWTMQNFAVDYCFDFMQALQGRTFPIKVNLFLIVNPPSWFQVIWKIMKPMLGKKFRRKVHMIPESKLHKYLMDDFEPFLVNEFQCGRATTSLMVKDFIEYQMQVEVAAARGDFSDSDGEISLSHSTGFGSLAGSTLYTE